MGQVCGGSAPVDSGTPIKAVVDEKSANRDIERNLKAEKKAAERLNRLLLLGPGDSGKSTFFKQLVIMNKGYTDAERLDLGLVVKLSFLYSLKHLIKGALSLGKLLNPSTIEFLDVLESFTDAKRTPDTASYSDGTFLKNIYMAWEDPGIQEAWESRSKLQNVPEFTVYFVENAERILGRDYIATDQDLLRMRSSTTGVITEKFSVNGADFQLIDVGGQRSERKKWIHAFKDQITAVLYVCAIGEYDMAVYEDTKTNRMHDALNVFEFVASREEFIETPIVVFLNKEDVFKVKLTKVPLSICFSDYRGDNSVESASEFIKGKFSERLELANRKVEETYSRRCKREVFMHMTCAMDPDRTRKLMDSIVSAFLLRSIQDLVMDV